MSQRLANTLARAVRAERARRGYSQVEFGARLGWSQSKVAAIEGGIRRIYVHELPEICQALEVGLLRLLQDAAEEDLLAMGLLRRRQVPAPPPHPEVEEP